MIVAKLKVPSRLNPSEVILDRLMYDRARKPRRVPGQPPQKAEASFLAKGHRRLLLAALFAFLIGIQQYAMLPWTRWIILLVIVAICVATVVIAVQSERTARIRVRWFRSRCQKCGYDLRESADKCPECGHPTPLGHRTHSQVMAGIEQLENGPSANELPTGIPAETNKPNSIESDPA
jgi:hypothetical protein